MSKLQWLFDPGNLGFKASPNTDRSATIITCSVALSTVYVCLLQEDKY